MGCKFLAAGKVRVVLEISEAARRLLQFGIAVVAQRIAVPYMVLALGLVAEDVGVVLGLVAEDVAVVLGLVAEDVAVLRLVAADAEAEGETRSEAEAAMGLDPADNTDTGHDHDLSLGTPAGKMLLVQSSYVDPLA